MHTVSLLVVILMVLGMAVAHSWAFLIGTVGGLVLLGTWLMQYVSRRVSDLLGTTHRPHCE
jgi:hypothetical protein